MKKILKKNVTNNLPKVSLILLDWSCRENFFALDWLADQSVDRGDYEIIWVELFDRVLDQVISKVDVYITCGQKGRYHKHIGYNAGLLEASGDVVTVCDSDAVFPKDFILSIHQNFNLFDGETHRSLVLMHYQHRTNSQYPGELKNFEDLERYEWVPLWENVGACVSLLRRDAVFLGGFDEHWTFRGYLCGPYDLAWRAINAGIPEKWHDPAVALWHFAHPNDDHEKLYQRFRLDTFLELGFVRPHFKEHAFSAVEAFSSGRLLPLRENSDVHALRMSWRTIGSEYEMEYSVQSDITKSSFVNMALNRLLHFETYALALIGKIFPKMVRIYIRFAKIAYSSSISQRRRKLLGTKSAVPD